MITTQNQPKKVLQIILEVKKVAANPQLSIPQI